MKQYNCIYFFLFFFFLSFQLKGIDRAAIFSKYSKYEFKGKQQQQLQKMINQLSKKKGGIIVIKKDELIFTESLNLKSNVFLYSEGIVLKVGKGVQDPFLRMVNFSNVKNSGILGNFVIEDENKNLSKFLGRKKKKKKEFDLYCVGIKIEGRCKNLFFENITIKHIPGTGFSIGSNFGKGTEPKNIFIKKIEAYNCWNAGVAITNGKSIVIDSIIVANCLSSSKYAQTGVDFEPNYGYEKIKNIKIGYCSTSNNNIGFQILAKNDHPKIKKIKNITIEKIKAFNNKDNGVNVSGTNGLTIKSGELYSNEGTGLYISDYIMNSSFCISSYKNGNRGVSMILSAKSLLRSKNITFTDSKFWDNHHSGIHLKAPSNFPIKNFACEKTNIYNTRSSTIQKYGIYIEGEIKKLKITGEIKNHPQKDMVLPDTQNMEKIKSKL